MSKFPTTAIVAPVRSVIGTESLNAEIIAIEGAYASKVLGQNRCYFVPIQIAQSVTVKQIFLVNGATVAGNLDVGIYDTQGNRIVSKGSTAQAGISALQAFDITDTLLTPGLYYLAIASDSTTATLQGVSFTQGTSARLGGVMQATGFPLGNPVTYAALGANVIPGVWATVETAI